MAAWRSAGHLRHHFTRHRRGLRVATIAAYLASADETILVGTAFEYRDPETDAPRIGYVDPFTGRFVGLSDDEEQILTHFRCNERYVTRTLPGSTYA